MPTTRGFAGSFAGVSSLNFHDSTLQARVERTFSRRAVANHKTKTTNDKK
jgi:hypothetical protein